MALSMADLNELSVDNIGSWPLPIKVVGALLIFAAIVGAGWYYAVKELQVQLEKVRNEEVDLKLAFKAKQKKAANLPALKQQL